MALTELIHEMRRQALEQKLREVRLLNRICDLSNKETVEAAVNLYDTEKHAYSYDGYIYQLEKLEKVLTGGVPPETALEAVDSCLDAETIISAYIEG